jgi:hypothetical protein
MPQFICDRTFGNLLSIVLALSPSIIVGLFMQAPKGAVILSLAAGLLCVMFLLISRSLTPISSGLVLPAAFLGFVIGCVPFIKPRIENFVGRFE